MALTRVQAATELANRTGRVLLAVGLTSLDTAGHLKEPLDDTFRALGEDWAGLPDATVDETQIDRFLAVGAVFVLRRALDEASGFADVAATQLGVSKSKSQIVKHLRERLAEAESHAAQYGIAELMPVMGSGVYIIDAIEPEDVA